MAQIHIAALLTVVAISSCSIVKSPTSSDGTFELLILHNNDMHARFEQTSQMSGTCTTADRDAGKCYGGFPRVAHVVKEARKAAASGEGPPVLYLNAGDTYTGTAWFTLYKWKIAAEFVNALQPDAVSLGNNELEKGSNELSPFLYELKTTILATNIILKSEESQKLQKSVVFDIKGTKVALVGYLTPEASILDSSGNIEYIDAVIALKDEVSKLQEQNIGIIIALGHSNVEKDVEIATEVEGLDIVIGGHKNVFYWNGTNTEEQFDKPIVVTQSSGKKVPVVPSYAYNKYLGKLYANFDNSGDMIAYKINPILLDESIAQDRVAIEITESHKSELVSLSEEVVGDTAVVLDGNSCKVEECNLGNLITDAINYYYALRFEGETWTDAAISIIPSGLIEASIAPANRPAAITIGDLQAVLPTESNLVAVTMSGPVLLQVLEHSVASYSVSNPNSHLLQMSGVRVVYDLAREPGSRIVSALVRCWACYVPEFYTIDERSYKVIMPASMASGEFGYTMLSSLPKEELVYDEITCAAEYIKLRSPVYPEVAGRIELLNVDDDNDDVEDGDNDDVEDGDNDDVEDGDNDDVEDGDNTGIEESNVPDSAISQSSTMSVICVAFVFLFNFQ